jgi:DNA-binding MarR family transcriptional regulator
MPRPWRAATPPVQVADGGGEAQIIEEASFALFELTLAALAEVPSVSVLQLRALAMIDRHGPMNLSEFARRLEQSGPSASRLVDRLVEARLARRDMALHSRREITLALTPKGRRTLTRVRDRRRAAMVAVLDRMTEAERAAVGTGLAAFSRAAESLTATAP